jgi:hypothetical protein
MNTIGEQDKVQHTSSFDGRHKIVKSGKKSEHIICNLSGCECIYQQRNRSKQS